MHEKYVPPQHRIKLVRYPPSLDDGPRKKQGVGAHKDSSGWLTFLYQVGKEEGLEVLDAEGQWLSAPPIEGTFVVNFGNAFESATEGAVKATVHRVKVRFLAWQSTGTKLQRLQRLHQTLDIRFHSFKVFPWI